VVNNDRKQIGIDDCGIFAIENCISLAGKACQKVLTDQR